MDASCFGQNLVYAHPTVAALGHCVAQHAQNHDAKVLTDSIAEMETLLEECTTNFPVHVATKPATEGRVVLVTGTTGSLGVNILQSLVNDPSIFRIYALNRPDGVMKRSLEERQKRACLEYGVDVRTLDSHKITLLEGDASFPDLNLPHEILQEIVNSVTHIIHNGKSSRLER